MRPAFTTSPQNKNQNKTEEVTRVTQRQTLSCRINLKRQAAVLRGLFSPCQPSVELVGAEEIIDAPPRKKRRQIALAENHPTNGRQLIPLDTTSSD